MKVYLVKTAVLKINEEGISVVEYRGHEDDNIFTSKKKAYAFIKWWSGRDWEHSMYPYETWNNKIPFYTYNKIKYYRRMELHEIEVN